MVRELKGEITMRKLSLLPVAAAVLLSGCSTLSFAPPGVRVKYAGEPNGTLECREVKQRSGEQTIEVERDVAGALRVVETYLDVFDCSARAAADGRQGFEIPAFLATTGAVVGAAFGLPSDYAIAGTAVNSAFNAGKAYYDPKQKALAYAHAADALRCIRSEAMGIDNFIMFKTESDDSSNKRVALRASDANRRQDPSIEVSAHQAYFVMVTDAAGAVGGILSDRLSNVGTINPTSAAAELEKLIGEIREKEKATQDAKDKGATNPTGVHGQAGFVAMTPLAIARAHQEKLIELNLKELQPKLQACVWRAKV